MTIIYTTGTDLPTLDADVGLLPGDWEMVIGLEVHAELSTVTKMFSPAPNHFRG